MLGFLCLESLLQISVISPNQKHHESYVCSLFPAVFISSLNAILKVSSNIIQRFNVCMNEHAIQHQWVLNGRRITSGCCCCHASWESSVPRKGVMRPPSRSSVCQILGPESFPKNVAPLWTNLVNFNIDFILR